MWPKITLPKGLSSRVRLKVIRPKIFVNSISSVEKNMGAKITAENA